MVYFVNMNFSPSPQSHNSLNAQETEKSPRIQIEKLYGHCSRVNTIKSGDVMVVGGSYFSNTSSQVSPPRLISDIDVFSDFYKKAQDRLEGVNFEQLRGLLDSSGCEMSEKIFAELLVFTRALAEEYPNASEHANNRQILYSNAQDGLRLSDAFKEGGAACVEISALAQGFLQEQGVESSIFNGEVLWDKNYEFADEHTFIILKDKGKTYIYDPANPVSNGIKPLPSVFVPMVDFEIETRKNVKKFVTSRNVITKGEVYYGVGNHANIIPERDII